MSRHFAPLHATHLAVEEPVVRWERRDAGRYYEVRVARGLFGEWFVMRYWGGIGSELGSELHDLATDRADALRRIQAVAKTRMQRGYVVVGSAAGPGDAESGRAARAA